MTILNNKEADLDHSVAKLDGITQERYHPNPDIVNFIMVILLF